MEFVWSDGGRAACGYVGLAGDCVTRSIAIATGLSYRDVYSELGESSLKSPRNGVFTDVSTEYLQRQGWSFTSGQDQKFNAALLPKGAVIVHLVSVHAHHRGHFCTVIDRVLYDTWDASDDENFVVRGFWTRPAQESDTTLPKVATGGRVSNEPTLTQKEFDKVLHRLRSLDNTASNSASTEGEKRNALRMMQNLMLRHNLTREDITEDDNVDSMCFTRMACPVNGRRACAWEKALAAYLVAEIFPMVRWYFGVRGHRTLFWFYGPLDDARNCLALFREMLLTIATSAQLQYGCYSRGSGASYAEGYVAGLPKYITPVDASDKCLSERALIHSRTLAVQQAAVDWLSLECGVSLRMTRGAGRSEHDPDAANLGKQHGAKQDLSTANGRKRITQQ